MRHPRQAVFSSRIPAVSAGYQHPGGPKNCQYQIENSPAMFRSRIETPEYIALEYI